MGAEVLLLDKILNSKFQRGLRHSAVGRQYFARLGQTKEKISNPFYRIINMLVVALLGEYWCVGLCNGGCIIIPSLPFSNILQSIPLTLADCV